jgi:hypothetical protein
MAKLAGLYQFPFGISGSFAFQARDGYVTPPFVEVYQDNIGWANLNANEPGNIGKFGGRRLPNFYELSLRIEKTFTVTEKLRFTVAAADCFSILTRPRPWNAPEPGGRQRLRTNARILNPRVFPRGVRASSKTTPIKQMLEPLPARPGGAHFFPGEGLRPWNSRVGSVTMRSGVKG